MIFLLKRLESAGYDEAVAFVVRAPSEPEARRLASPGAGDEGATVWIRETLSTCEAIEVAGASEVLLRDFCAG